MKQKSVKSVIKICAEYFSLFVDQHIAPLPEGVTCGALAPEWKEQLKLRTDRAWKAAQAFATAQGTSKLSESASGFKRFMFALDPSNLPQGPSDETTFQPPTRYPRLRTRANLVDHMTVPSPEDYINDDAGLDVID